jgi:hypothetical protein
MPAQEGLRLDNEQRFASEEIRTCSKQERGTERFGPAYYALLDLLKTSSYQPPDVIEKTLHSVRLS